MIYLRYKRLQEGKYTWFSDNLPLMLISFVSITYPWLYMTPILHYFSLIFICDERKPNKVVEPLRDCAAFYYPIICFATILMIILVIFVGIIFISTSFENFFSKDALQRIPCPIDYQLINLRVIIICCNLLIGVMPSIFSILYN